jgi:hypothetical protein
MLKEEVIVNIRELLNENFIFISESFSIEEILAMIEIILDNNVFAYGNIY